LTRAALYVRVSAPGQDLNTQEADLRSYALSRAWDPCESFREQVTGTGTKIRPEFNRLQAAIVAGAVDVVLVTKLDRIARSVPDALEFFDLAEQHHVRVVATTQSIDTENPAGRLTRTILAAVAEFEGELIRERTRAAMIAIKEGRKPTRTGRLPGRPRRVEPDAVSRAQELRGLGHSWPQIAQLLGLKAETIRRAVWAQRGRPVAVVNPQSGESVDSPGGTRARE
jgi:DNA invertase Pin-like site-specific DNA recombinase